MPVNPKMIVVEAMPTGTGPSLGLSLACTTPGVVIGGGAELDLRAIGKPVYILVKLVAGSGLRFLDQPADAAWFGHGTGNPTGPGTAGGRFDPDAVSYDGAMLLFRAVGQGGPKQAGQGSQFAALLRFEAATPAAPTQQTGTTTLAAAVRSGGPIIIND